LEREILKGGPGGRVIVRFRGRLEEIVSEETRIRL
jgi:hypothetical protein